MSDASDNESKDEAEAGQNIGTPLGDEAGIHIPSDQLDPEDGEAPIDFGGFIVSLGTSCMVNLGHVENPETGQKAHADLPAAAQTIEILKLLKHKTEGNLEPEEEKLLETLIHDTQLAYKKAKKRQEQT